MSTINEYEMKVIIPEPGKWFVYLLACLPCNKQARNSKQVVFTCYDDLSGCLRNNIFPIVNDVVKKYQIKYQPIFVQSETCEFITQVDCMPSIHFQT